MTEDTDFEEMQRLSLWAEIRVAQLRVLGEESRRQHDVVIQYGRWLVKALAKGDKQGIEELLEQAELDVVDIREPFKARLRMLIEGYRYIVSYVG